MTNDRIREFVTLLYTHKAFVSSEGVHKKTSAKLKEFLTRMNKNKDYYNKNGLITSSFDFIEKVIDFWFEKGNIYIHEKTETFCKSDVCFRTWLYFLLTSETAGDLRYWVSGGLLKVIWV